jgi:amino acid adenylation domain-containing protein
MDEQKTFFDDLLHDVEEPTAPFGILEVGPYGFDDLYHELDSESTQRLLEISRNLQVSPASLWHVAWAQVLARVSFCDKVVFGTVLLSREEKSGCLSPGFAHILPILIPIDQEGAELSVRRSDGLLRELRRYQQTPLELAQRCSNLVGPGRLFSAVLEYRSRVRLDPAAASLEGVAPPLEGTEWHDTKETSTYPFLLVVEQRLEPEGAESFMLRLRTPAAIQASRLCNFVRRALESLLAALESSAPTAVFALDVLPEQELRQVLYDWNDTDVAYASDRCIHELFEEQVERTPNARAVEYEEVSLTYSELNRRANRLAHYLRTLGVRTDQRVAICMERGLAFIEAILGVLKAGGAYVPMDPAYPQERLQAMLEDSTPAVLLVQRHVRNSFAGYDVTACTIDHPGVTAAWNDQPEINPGRAGAGLTLESLAYVIYTSGSTGHPKGVMIEHRSLSNYMQWAHRSYYINSGSGSPAVHSIGFGGIVTTLFGPLIAGQTLTLLRPGTEMESLGRSAMWEGNPFTLVKVTPAHLKLLNRAMSKDKAYAPTQTLMIGGETLVPSDVRLWQQRFPKVRLVSHFGSTETTTGCCSFEISGAVSEDSFIPIGRPVANTKLYILDRHLRPAPVGLAGELWVGGVQVARGYLNRPDLTAERFVKDPFVQGPAARMYNTGDLARWLPDGNIEFLGRRDSQIKIRGVRIELGEIEARLASYPAVKEAAVKVYEDEPGDKRLIAYYTLRSMHSDQLGDRLNHGVVAAAEQLRLHLSQKLPAYMVPCAYVRLESMPLTPNGKLDRKALPPPRGDIYAGREYEAPVGLKEEMLERMWRDLLRVPRVGRHDNFFHLGGHSLLAVSLIEQIRKRGFDVEVGTLFAAPTLTSLAAALVDATVHEFPENGVPSECDVILPEMLTLVKLTQDQIEKIASEVRGGTGNIQDIYPLAPLQEGILFHHRMQTNGDPYLLLTVLAFRSKGRLEEYVRALDVVIDRHDILKTAVMWEGLPEPVQVVWRKATLPVEEVELDGARGDAADQIYARWNPRTYRMDVRRAPLLRAYIAYDEPNRRWLMLLLKHHLIGDRIATQVMQEEVQACLLGQAHLLPASRPFREFVARTRLSVSHEEQQAFFKRLLGDLERPTLPLGLVDVLGDGSAIEEARSIVDYATSQRIRKQARKIGVSSASLCHVAWARVLAKVTGQDDVVFGTVLFGRTQGGSGADRALGLFMNTLPVRIRIENESVEASVRQTHKLLAELLRHEHTSLALAQRCSGVAAPAPLFSALLNYVYCKTETEELTANGSRAWEGIQVLREEERTNFPLALVIEDLGDGFRLIVQVRRPISAERLCGYTAHALNGLSQLLEWNPETPVREVPVMLQQERELVLQEWNNTRVEYAAQKCVHHLFEEQVEKTPDAVAVEHQDESLSYAELNAQANQLAHHLRRLGIGAEKRVAICLERGIGMVVALLGVLKAGAAYVPLDPSYPKERLLFMLEDCKPRVLLTQGEAKWGLASAKGEALRMDLAETAQWQTGPRGNPDPKSVGLTPSNLAYIIYTSGSTGMPKGVMIPHCALSNFLCAMQEELGTQAHETWLATTTLSFDIAGFELYAPLTRGARVRILSRETTIDGARLLSELRLKHSVVQATPATWRVILAAGWRGTEGLNVLCGGEALDPGLARQLVSRSASAWNLYGPTETTIWSMMCRLGGIGDVVPIGRPIANTQVYLLDSTGEPAPIHVAGELFLGGAGVGRGYWRRPELTAERFLPDSFAQQSGSLMYRTGDLARWLEDGQVEFLGRTDSQVKVRGYRIELGEIETRLLEHPGVGEAVVVAQEDGSGEKRLVAYYTAASVGKNRTDCARPPDGLSEDLRLHLAGRIPHFMVPVSYIPLRSMPLTQNGKIDRKALHALLTSPNQTSADCEVPVTWRSELEKKIGDLWRDLLHVSSIRPDDNFFDLGGHSLLATRMLEALAEMLPKRLAMIDLFTYPTIRSLAAYLEKRDPPAVAKATADHRSRLRREYLRRKKEGNRKEVVL